MTTVSRSQVATTRNAGDGLAVGRQVLRSHLVQTPCEILMRLRFIFDYIPGNNTSYAHTNYLSYQNNRQSITDNLQ